jgi:hypothetical protein
MCVNCNYHLDYINHNYYSLNTLNQGFFFFFFFVKWIKDYTLEYNNSFRKHKMHTNQLITNKLNNKYHFFFFFNEPNITFICFNIYII